MSKRPTHREGPSPLEWIETAGRLLRSAPAGALLSYYFGSATCLLGLLYFWADMSRGAFAADHLIEAAFNAALLYIWMKCWQTVFLSKLRSHLFMEAEEPWTVRRVARLVLIQASLQPLGLFARFIAANLLLPYIWTYSLFVGMAIMGDGREGSLHAVLRRSVGEAKLWWRETHLALLCLLGFAIFIWLNIFTGSLFLPEMLHSLFGIDTLFTRDRWAMLNTTFFAATFAATYLCFDPLRKAVFLVRHFHGQSLQTGEDLRVELRALRGRSRLAGATLLVLAMLLLGAPTPVRAETPPPSAAPARIESADLNSSLDRVLERREYAWRFPRSTEAESGEKGWLEGFFDSVAKTLVRWMKKAGGWVDRFIEWLRKLFQKDSDNTEYTSREINWSRVARTTLIILGVVLVLLVGMLLWRARQRRGKIVMAEAVTPMPDLNEESVTADQLPEDGWIRLARELISQGEIRLALRAYYLASLAHLGQREFIRLERYKSNHDYDRELQRRARGNGPLLEAFDENLLIFERAWYGDHEVTLQTLDGFSQNIERIRAC